MKMANWNTKVRIKHLLTEDETHAGVQTAMTAIADVLDSTYEFTFIGRSFFDKLRNIPQGDDVFGPADYTNRLLERMYAYADDRRIWID